MKTNFSAIFFGLVVVSFLSCTKESVGKRVDATLSNNVAEATHFSSFVHEVYTSYIPCTNEDVDFVGKIHLNIQSVYVGKNKWNYTYIFNKQGLTGIGETTGIKYSGSGHSTGHFSATSNGMSWDITNETTTSTIKLVAQGGSSITYTILFKINMNADGTPVVSINKTSLSGCE